MKNKKLILCMTMLTISGALDARTVYRYPRVPYRPPVFGPQHPQFARQQLVIRLEKKYEELLKYLEKVKVCFKDQTCSTKVLEQTSSAATMLVMLAAFAYVGKKAISGALEEEKIRIAPPMAQPITVEEKPRPEFPEVPTHEPSWDKAEKVADAVQVPSKVVIGVQRKRAESVFNFVKNKITDDMVDRIAYLIPTYAHGEGIYDLNKINIGGYSLIGAALQSQLSNASKNEVIEYLLSYPRIEPTFEDKNLAKKLRFNL